MLLQGLGNPGISCDDVLDFILRAVAPDHGLSNASVQQLVDAVSSQVPERSCLPLFTLLYSEVPLLFPCPPQLKQAAALLVGTTSTASAYADATAAELQEGASNRHETAAADAQLQEAQKQVAQAAYSCQQLADAQVCRPGPRVSGDYTLCFAMMAGPGFMGHCFPVHGCSAASTRRGGS